MCHCSYMGIFWIWGFCFGICECVCIGVCVCVCVSFVATVHRDANAILHNLLHLKP